MNQNVTVYSMDAFERSKVVSRALRYEHISYSKANQDKAHRYCGVQHW